MDLNWKQVVFFLHAQSHLLQSPWFLSWPVYRTSISCPLNITCLCIIEKVHTNVWTKRERNLCVLNHWHKRGVFRSRNVWWNMVWKGGKICPTKASLSFKAKEIYFVQSTNCYDACTFASFDASGYVTDLHNILWLCFILDRHRSPSNIYLNFPKYFEPFCFIQWGFLKLLLSFLNGVSSIL